MIPHEQAAEATASHCRYRWVPSGTYLNHDTLPFSPVVALEVVEDCFFVADGSVVSNARPVALAEWELGHPREVRHTARGERVPNTSRTELHRLKSEYHWLEEYFPFLGSRQPRKPAADSDMLAFCDEAFVGEEPGELDLVRDDPVEVALRDHAHGGTDFFTRMREVSHHGAYAVHVGAEAMRGLPREWCRAYSLPTATSMSIAWYDVEIASSICR